MTGNRHVMNWFEVPGITTSKIRVLVNGGGGGHSRIVEVEAWDGRDSTSNVALASHGTKATASSSNSSNFLPVAAINGDRKGIHWSSDPTTGSGWVDGTPGSFPDWLQVDFGESKNLKRIYVYTAQDDLANPVDPNPSLPFRQHGLTAFQVQYWSGSAWVDLPNIAESRAFQINDAGTVVGDSGHAAGPNNKLPFQWRNGVMTTLGGSRAPAQKAPPLRSIARESLWDRFAIPPPDSRIPISGQPALMWIWERWGKTGTWAHDINDATPVQIVGAAETDPRSLTTRAWVWSSCHRQGAHSAASRRNLEFRHRHQQPRPRGRIQQYHRLRTARLLKVGSTVTDLGTLGGPWSTAQDINDAGLIVGASRIDATTPGQPRHAFSCSAAGPMVDLGTLGGGIHSWAFGVNDAGVIVGTASTSSGAERAFVYDSVHGMRDLNALTSGSGWSLTVARSINSSGQIVGWGLDPTGIPRAFLLTPLRISRAVCGRRG